MSTGGARSSREPVAVDDWLVGQAGGDRVLDVTCGRGARGSHLEVRGYEVVRVDADDGCVAAALEALAGEQGAGFDCVLLGEALGRTTERTRVLELAIRALKPGGRLVIMTAFGPSAGAGGRGVVFSELLDALGARVTPEHVSLTEGYLQLVGRAEAPEATGATFDTGRLLRMTEEELFRRDQLSRTFAAREQPEGPAQRAGAAEAAPTARRGLGSFARTVRRRPEWRRFEKKYKKLRRDPDQFFQDSRSPMVRRAGRLASAIRLRARRDAMEVRTGEPSATHTADEMARRLVRLTDRPRWCFVPLPENRQVALWGRVRAEDPGSCGRGFALVRVEYYDDQNQQVRTSRGLSHSPAVGAFRYLPVHSTTGEPAELVRLAPPARARGAWLGFQKWNAEQDVHLSELLVRRDLDVSVSQSGPGDADRRPLDELRLEAATAGWADADPPPDPAKPKVLAVMDEFTRACFAPEANLIRPRPDNWQALLEHYGAHLFFVESAWQGNGRTWQYRVGKYDRPPGQELEDVAARARADGLPLVFWNKEDPVHWERFIDAAGLATTVFTTDAAKIPDYRDALGHDRIHALPFAAQPRLHRPKGLAGRERGLCFAGSWYGGRHAERERTMSFMLRAAKPFGLRIYDRNYGSGLFPFPEEYRDSVRGGLPYEELCREYARHRVFLNVNSVVDSPTMFSRRVFELLASGTPVVSTYARGIEEVLGTEAVWMVHDEKQAQEAFRVLLEDDAEWRRRSLLGIRAVFSAHTYGHRLAEVLRRVGRGDAADAEPRALLLVDAAADPDLSAVAEFHRSQTWRHFDLAIAGVDPDEARRRFEGTAVALQRTERIGEQVVELLRSGGYDLVGQLDPGAHYGGHYLQDLVNATRYAPEAAVWSKSPDDNELVYDVDIEPAACVFRVRDLLAERPPEGPELLPSSPGPLRTFRADREEYAPCAASRAR